MPGLSAAFERIGEALERHLPISHAPGAAIAVTDPHETLGVVVRGFADVASGAPIRPETRFLIGSISKSFAAIVVLREVEAGRLDLDVRVNELLPWLELPEPFGPITLHHLLTHTGGLATGTEDAPTGLGAATRLREIPPTFPPGERFWYSNDGYKLVGLVLERVTGLPIHELLRTRVLEPLEMSWSTAAITDGIRTDLATGYEPIFTDRPAQLHHPLMPATFTVSNSADGSIASNVLDMSAYARLILNRGHGPAGVVLSEAMFDRLTTPMVEQPDDPGVSYGYGLDVGADERGRFISHGGGMVGYTASFAVRPDDGFGVVILQNGGGSKAPLLRHVVDVLNAVFRDGPRPEPWIPPEATTIARPEDYVGIYDGDDGRTLGVEAVDDGLRLVLGPLSVRLERDPLADGARDAFFLPHPALERFLLRFARDADGRVVEAFHGGTWFRGDGYRGPEPGEPPAAWRAFPGLYRNDDPWMPTLRVVLRKGRLALGVPVELSDEEGEVELDPLDDGSFAVGERWEPRRIRFDRIVDGHAALAAFNGGQWFRSFEE